MHDIQEVSCVKNARACMKCSSWIVKEDGQEKKSNIYKKMRLCVALCGGQWKKRKIRRWGRSERVDEKKEKKKKEK